MVAVRSLAAGGALWFALQSPAGAHDAHDVPKAADSHAAHTSMQAAPAQQKQPLAAHLVAWQRRYLDVQLAMVVMDTYDDNGAAISQALAQMNLPPQVAQHANAEPMPERLRAALDAGWRGEMPRTVWIGRDGTREERSGLLTADVLDSWLQRAKR
ncbi:TlpA family protein disulfide reductase [Burkholderia lata]|uniref:TlpA family protein disulfide reductase n=1 Tax=Burkholderia lata (strain ATCC 17760 / DSM 23089 / LMG 22485 / NCIMB 9086 / R18194 / 383) TaxID=482957 RepID=UPI00399AFDC7